jgi:hypothetical protein
MAKVSRARRAELQHAAHELRREGQRGGWPVARIAAAIRATLPDVLPLEAWRLAYGWSRPQAAAGITALYEADGLAPPPLNPSMLCRWEHGKYPPGEDYARMLCRLYQADARQLGLGPVRVVPGTGCPPRGVPSPEGRHRHIRGLWERVPDDSRGRRRRAGGSTRVS